MQANFLGSGI